MLTLRILISVILCTDKITIRPIFGALSTPVLKKNLELIGFTDVQEVKKAPLAGGSQAQHMARIIVVARKLRTEHGPGGWHARRSME
jgi:hypothetical protein